VQLDRRVEVLLDPAVFVHDPLAEIPGDFQHLVRVPFGYQFLRISSEVFENFVSFLAVHMDFIHERKLNTVLFGDLGLDLLVAVRLLINKVIAWEGYYLKTSVFVFLVRLCELEVVLLGEGSVRGYIRDDHGPGVLSEVTEHALVQVDVLDRDGPQLFRY